MHSPRHDNESIPSICIVSTPSADDLLHFEWLEIDSLEVVTLFQFHSFQHFVSDINVPNHHRS